MKKNKYNLIGTFCGGLLIGCSIVSINNIGYSINNIGGIIIGLLTTVGFVFHIFVDDIKLPEDYNRDYLKQKVTNNITITILLIVILLVLIPMIKHIRHEINKPKPYAVKKLTMYYPDHIETVVITNNSHHTCFTGGYDGVYVRINNKLVRTFSGTYTIEPLGCVMLTKDELNGK